RAPSAPPAKGGLPMVPIAVAAAVIVLGGGGYLFKDALLGRGADSTGTGDSVPLSIQTPVPPDTGRPAGTDPGPVTPLSHPDTAKPADPGNVRPAGGRTTPGTTPGGTTNPRTDPPTQPDHAALERQVLGFFDDIGFEDDPAKRLEARRVGQQVFATTSIARPVRAKAAWLVMQGYLKEGNADKAREWLDNAIELDPSQQSWKTLRAQM
ncbi:MAG TPA: hypothetical protein PKA50_10800, partial [Gemmatimonadales bacterium]|nr:hypothetical protein [Gemmatimonadales bacterium]